MYEEHHLKKNNYVITCKEEIKIAVEMFKVRGIKEVGKTSRTQNILGPSALPLATALPVHAGQQPFPSLHPFQPTLQSDGSFRSLSLL
jgi:hypothetical protein